MRYVIPRTMISVMSSKDESKTKNAARMGDTKTQPHQAVWITIFVDISNLQGIAQSQCWALIAYVKSWVAG